MQDEDDPGSGSSTTRRLVGVADMSGGPLDRVVAALALASAMNGQVVTESDVRAVLRRDGVSVEGSVVDEVLRRVAAPAGTAPSPHSSREERR